MYIYIYVYIYIHIYIIEHVHVMHAGALAWAAWHLRRNGPELGLYTILPLPILYGMYCDKGWPGGATLYCAIV